MRIWMRLVPAVVLTLLIAASPLRAADDNTSLNDKLNQLSKKVETLEKDVKDNGLRGNRIEAELREIKEELSRIRVLMERMAFQQGVIQRQAGYGPGMIPGGLPAGGSTTTGTITLQNDYNAPATVRINDQSYFIEPNRRRMVPNFPYGPFQYSVDVQGFGMVEQPHTETLRSPGFRIRIFPSIPF